MGYAAAELGDGCGGGFLVGDAGRRARWGRRESVGIAGGIGGDGGFGVLADRAGWRDLERRRGRRDSFDDGGKEDASVFGHFCLVFV